MSDADDYLPPEDLASIHRWLAAARKNPSAYIKQGQDSVVERLGGTLPETPAYLDPLTCPLPQGHRRVMGLMMPRPGRPGEWELYDMKEMEDVMRERAANGLK